jgi:PKD repeat protein
MRITTFVSLLGVAALAAVAGCVKDVDQPALAGPSTFAHSIIMVADRDTLTQNGVDFTDIRITSLSPSGTSENVPLRAQIYVDGVPNDFGTLSSKSPITPATIRYTAPPASSVTTAQVPTTVTIGVTLAGSGDFRGETTRTIDINLQPQGIIIPTNPNLVAAFTFTPAAPQVAQTVAFDASTSTNSGTACLTLCSYVWDFGDGTGGIGLTTTHEFRKAGIFPVKLTVTDSRGASSSKTTSITVAPGTPPTASFTVSPTPPPTNVDIFFNATASRAATGRTITSYIWEFGDGTGASGPIVTHKFTGAGSFVVMLTVTDDAGSQTQVSQTLAVGTAASNPIAQLTTTLSGRRVLADASASTPGTGATIVSYRFDYGDGSTPEIVTNPVQSHTYTGPGTFIVQVEITDSNGKTASKTVSITVL